jgi:hypothetical protein
MGAPPFVRGPGAYRPPRSLVAGLFEGVPLSAEQEARAHQIVTEAIEAQMAVTLRNADGWARILDIQTNRDRALRDLLTSDDHRSAFDAHSAELRRRQGELRPASTAAPIVLRVGLAPLLGGTLEIVFRADGMSEEAIETASWQIVHSFRGDAEQVGVTRVTTIADILERRDEYATYVRSIKRTFGKQADGAWVPLPAP